MKLCLPLLFLAAACGDAGPVASRVEGYIRADQYARLVLEIDSVPGFGPRAAAQGGLIARLGPILDKPGGISAVADDALGAVGASHVWTFAELDALAGATFDLAVPADTTKMHVLFVDGGYEADTSSSKVLGIAWANTHVVMFKQTVEEICASAPSLVREQVCEAAEEGVWTHETGHLLGLVDNGLPMVTDHEDGAHSGHDQDDGCVMYWAYEGQGLVDLFVTRILGGNDAKLDFDEACKADLAAVRNR